MREITEVDHIVGLLFLFLNVWYAATFLVCKKLLMESHPACIAGSKQHIGNPISEANVCIGYRHWYQF